MFFFSFGYLICGLEQWSWSWSWSWLEIGNGREDREDGFWVLEITQRKRWREGMSVCVCVCGTKKEKGVSNPLSTRLSSTATQMLSL